MRLVNNRSIGSWWVVKIFNASELPAASRTVNPSARSVLAQINIIDGSLLAFTSAIAAEAS